MYPCPVEKGYASRHKHVQWYSIIRQRWCGKLPLHPKSMTLDWIKSMSTCSFNWKQRNVVYQLLVANFNIIIEFDTKKIYLLHLEHNNDHFLSPLIPILCTVFKTYRKLLFFSSNKRLDNCNTKHIDLDTHLP